MSLLASTNSGSSSVSYFIENVGSPAGVDFSTPCIKGSTVGAIRVGDPETGLVLRGDLGGVSSFIRGGAAAGSNLSIGSSTASFNSIVLTDGLTTINTSLAMPVAGSSLVLDGDVGLGGDLILTNGQAQGKSITGYYAASVPVAVVAGVNPVANPAGLTEGWYAIGVAQPAGGVNNGSKMPGCIGHYTGALWDSGAFGGDVAVMYICPNDAHTQLIIVSAAGYPGAVVSFAKLLN